jgi:hypothetical protein
VTTTQEYKDQWIKAHFGLTGDTQAETVNMATATEITATVQTEFHIQNPKGHNIKFELVDMMDGATRVIMHQGFQDPLLATHPFNAEEARNIWRNKIANGYVRIK